MTRWIASTAEVKLAAVECIRRFHFLEPNRIMMGFAAAVKRPTFREATFRPVCCLLLRRHRQLRRPAEVTDDKCGLADYASDGLIGSLPGSPPATGRQ